MPIPTGFPESNMVLTGNGESVLNLPVYRDAEKSISCWSFTEEEIEELKQNNGRLFVAVFTYDKQHPCMFMAPRIPDEFKEEKEPEERFPKVAVDPETPTPSSILVFDEKQGGEILRVTPNGRIIVDGLDCTDDNGMIAHAMRKVAVLIARQNRET